MVNSQKQGSLFKKITFSWVILSLCAFSAFSEDFPKPYVFPAVERENVFAFTQKPEVKLLGKDDYEITFSVKGHCDVTVGLIDEKDAVIRHIGSGVLGSNAPKPFQKDSLKQTLYWDGRNDLGEYELNPEKIRVRVMLGLKPTFDKRIGGTSGHNLPGFVWGISIDKTGAYVFTEGSISHGHRTLRKFDHEAKYVKTLMPPPANLPESKLAGLSYVEYEKGKKALHGVNLEELSRDGFMLPTFADGGYGPSNCQPAITGGKIFIPTGTPFNFNNKEKITVKGLGKLHYLYTDGSTDVAGMKGRPSTPGGTKSPALVASPDGKTIYMSPSGARHPQHAVYKFSVSGVKRGEVFAGNPKKSGNNNKSLNTPTGIECDAQGRVYVGDSINNRIQVYSPEGKYLKSIQVDRPERICIHRKTGAIYVLHKTRVEGRTVNRLTKFTSFDRPKEEFHQDNFTAVVMALDSWTDKPRLWTGGSKAWIDLTSVYGSGPSVRIFEERDGQFVQIMDFDEVAKKEAGEGYFGRFSGSASDNRNYGSPKSVCNPVTEKLYYRHHMIFDLKTGVYEGQFSVPDTRYGVDDIAIDKRGYMHGHTWGSGPEARVWRVDPSRGKIVSPGRGTLPKGKDIITNKLNKPMFLFPEVPYDYGEERLIKKSPKGDDIVLTGGLPVKSQTCAHPWQHGLGVNMCGEIAVSSRISYMPNMGKMSEDLGFVGQKARKATGIYVDGAKLNAYKKNLADLLKKGGEMYSIKRRPGIPLYGDTIWTFDRTGEQRYKDPSAIIGDRLAGVQMDEEGFLYFGTFRNRMIGGKKFLSGHGGTFGVPKGKSHTEPYLGTYIKSQPKGVSVLMSKSVVPLDPLPKRPPELWAGDQNNGANWIKGAEWLYAGASPIVEGGCECPSSRAHLDWYKRSFVQEVYRHSIGILDTNGNLIMHLGKYGNFDSANGDDSLIKVGGDNIGMFMPRYIGGTDNYLVFNDWGERLVVLKLNYHAEETVPLLVEEK